MAEFKNGKSGRGKKKLSFSMKQRVLLMLVALVCNFIFFVPTILCG